MDICEANIQGKLKRSKIDETSVVNVDIQSQQRSINGYKICHLLGKSNKARVELGISLTTNEHVALKTYNLDQFPSEKKKFLLREITAMRNLSHMNIVRLIDYDFHATYPKKKGATKKVVLLVMELAEGGTLFDFIRHQAFSEEVARTLFASLLDALDCCHRAGISHRDLKLDNLLFDAQYQLKVADFGYAAIVVTGTGPSLTTTCGTLEYGYIAPEVLRHDGSAYEGTKADVWSAGVVLFLMMTKQPPFNSTEETDWWFNEVQNGRYDSFWFAHLRSCPGLSDTFQDLINRMFVVKPEERASLQEIRDHPWMQGQVLSQHELAQELGSLKAQYNQLNNQQQNAARAAAIAQRARAQDGSPPPNAFLRNTTRSTSLCLPPSLPDFLVGADVLYSPQTTEDVFTCIHSACGEMKAQILKSKQSGLKIRAEFQHSSASGLSPIEVAFKLYTICIQGNDLSVLHLECRAGDLFEYQKIHKAFADRFAQSSSETYHQQQEKISNHPDASRKFLDEIDLLP